MIHKDRFALIGFLGLLYKLDIAKWYNCGTYEVENFLSTYRRK